MTYRVLVSAPPFQSVIDQFAEEFSGNGLEPVLPTVRERLSERELLGLVSDIDGAICGDDQYTEKVIAAAPCLRVISKWGTGIDSIDLDACHKRGIQVCNTPNAFSNPVADSALAYILFLVRQLSRLNRDMQSSLWIRRPAPSLRECCVGLIGIGNIGQKVAQRLAGFGCRILANDPRIPAQDFLDKYNVQMVEKSILLTQSDVISLHCDLNPSSFHIIDEEALSLMKSSAYVVNTSRGSLIDELALTTFLEAGQIAGAAMDVFEIEPLPSGSKLLKLDNVFLAPHNANSSPVAWEKIHRRTFENLIAHLLDKQTILNSGSSAAISVD